MSTLKNIFTLKKEVETNTEANNVEEEQQDKTYFF